MRVRWTRRALRALDGIAEHIARDRPEAARRAVGRVRDGVARLSEFPSMGRPGRVHGTRELVVDDAPLIVVYRVREDTVEILVVLHSARKWPEGF